MALLLGFTGSFHCAGMCGPIVWVMPFQALGGLRKWIGMLLYHFGRISVYAMLAVLLQSFKSIFHPGVQQYISIGLGAILLIAGILSFYSQHFRIRLPWANFVTNNLGKYISNPKIGSFFIAGTLNGMLPCGLVYIALSAANTTNTIPGAMSFMYLFGIGTMPMLMSMSLIKTRISGHLHWFKKMIPLTVMVFGFLFILRGMNLGIPYLSPKIAMTEHGVKACCCHKH